MKKTTKPSEKKTALYFTLLAVMLVLIILLSFCTGKYALSVREILSLLTGTGASETDAMVMSVLRIPRTLLAVLGGFAFGIAGYIYQIVFKNPLASPDIIGVASGANLGSAIAIVIGFSTGTMALAVGSFLGGLIAVLLVLLLSKLTRSISTSTYILCGIIINSFTRSMIMLLKYFADTDSRLASIEYWEMGTLGNITMNKFLVIAPILVAAIIIALLMARPITMLAMNDVEARSLGVRVRPLRIAAILLGMVLVSSVICLTGLISFIGLIAPHIARQMLKHNHPNTMLASGLIGAILLLASDVIVRAIPNANIPISIITAVFGLPALIYFMCRKERAYE